MGIISRLLERIGRIATKNHIAHPPVYVSPVLGFTLSHEAKRRILNGEASADLRTDKLRFDHDEQITSLPEDLTVRQLIVEDCPNFRSLPRGLLAENVSVRSCGMFSDIVPDMYVRDLSIRNCPNLTALPTGLTLDTLLVEDCPNLTHLPERIDCRSLRLPNSRIERILDAPLVDNVVDLQGSNRLKSIPSMKLKELILRGCTNFESNLCGMSDVGRQHSTVTRIVERERKKARSMTHS